LSVVEHSSAMLCRFDFIQPLTFREEKNAFIFEEIYGQPDPEDIGDVLLRNVGKYSPLK